MRNFIKLLACAIFILVATEANAQSDFEKYRQQRQKEFEQYMQQSQDKFKRYKDSINLEFATYLEKEWQDHKLDKPKPFITNPIPIPPIYKPSEPKPEPTEPPVAVTPIVPPVPTPQIPIPEIVPEPNPVPHKTVDALFFGTAIKLKDLSLNSIRLSEVSEKAIGKYWKELTNIPYLDIVSETNRIKAELHLNDWGVYQLLGTVFETHIPGGRANEKIIFSIFMLNQMGYKAKIGMDNQHLYSLVAFDNEVTNCMSFSFGGDSRRYYMLNPEHRNLQSVKSCSIDYHDAVNGLDLRIIENPHFGINLIQKSLAFAGAKYDLELNKNIVDFYSDYPLTEFAIYAESPLDEIAWQSLKEKISPNIINKSEEDAVNWLLHFIQNAFNYKTDGDQFGYEKWNFAEETLASSFSDCDDRAILFAQLARRFLNVPVVLVYYPGEHLATAIKFKDSAIAGDYIIVDSDRYLICDPTYINANLGMAMPQLLNSNIEVYRVK